MLLVETQQFTSSKLQLSEAKNGNLIVEGVLATAEVKNGNGRYYRRDIWERELDKYQQVIQEKRALGELDHPESPIINLQNVSHNITKCWWDDDHIMGRIEILPTPSGNILKALIESNILVGVSSRGQGSLKQVGEVAEVQDDFELLCWDFVSTPSNPGSWMHEVGFINEGLAKNSVGKYNKVNDIVREILCSKGSCPLC